MGLNAEEISEEVQNSWRTLHKLVKSFTDNNPRKVADFTKLKIERFKNHLPVLQIICNPGLKPRHWGLVIQSQKILIFYVFLTFFCLKISQIVGKDILPDNTSSLQDMLDIGLNKFVDK